MPVIELDATSWVTPHDFYAALLTSLGAPKEHGHNINALTESVVWGGMNVIEPPYTIRIHHTGNLSQDVISEIDLARHAIAEARADFRARRGCDVDVQLEIISGKIH